jgi:hypothetical protein
MLTAENEMTQEAIAETIVHSKILCNTLANEREKGSEREERLLMSFFFGPLFWSMGNFLQ